jgi:hypothetical protein
MTRLSGAERLDAVIAARQAVIAHVHVLEVLDANAPNGPDHSGYDQYQFNGYVRLTELAQELVRAEDSLALYQATGDGMVDG